LLTVERFKDSQILEIQSHNIGLSALLYHLEKLPGVKVLSKFSFPMTDECWADFTYKGNSFSIDSPFSYLWVHGNDGGVPENEFQEIQTHIQTFNPWNVLEIPARLAFGLKYLFKPLPKWNKDNSASK
jgi:hypothetical protein